MVFKACTECSQTKDLSAYYTRSRILKYPDTASGYQSICKECYKAQRAVYVAANKQKCRESDRKRYKSKPEIFRAWNYKRNFGITIDEYNQMFTLQEGKCAGCSRHQSELSKRLAIDHDHDTGQIRGLLCQNCNRALGLVKDRPSVLVNLAGYLQNPPVGNLISLKKAG